MAYIDSNLSNIDKQGYVQAKRPERIPSFLGVSVAGHPYQYTLLTAHALEAYRSRQRPSVEHTHAVYHLVFYVSGKGLMRYQGNTIPIQQGQVALISPNQPHAFTPPGGAVAYHAITFALVDGNTNLDLPLQTLLGHYLGRDLTIPPLSRPDASLFHLLQQKAERIVRELQQHPIDWAQHQQHMIELFRLLAQLDTFPQAHTSLAERARNLLEAQFAERTLSLQRLAALLHTSPENLCRCFRKQTGQSPIQYRNELRVQAATELLRHTNLPCKAIAYQVGFADVFTFSKAFRRHTGTPPTQARMPR